MTAGRKADPKPGASWREIADFFGALADEGRLRLLSLLLQKGEACVVELCRLTGWSQSTVSQRLGVLRRVGLIEAQPRGKENHYRLASPLARAMLALVCGEKPSC